MSDVELQQAIEIVRKLSPEEQAQLVAQVVADLAHKTMEVSTSVAEQPAADVADTRTWGQKLVDKINQLEFDPDDFESQDPEEWVRNYRRTQTSRRNPGWGEE